MNIKDYINQVEIAEDKDKAKLQLLNSVTNLLLSFSKESLSETLKFFAILAKTYHIEMSRTKSEFPKNITKAILYKMSEIIQNKEGYAKLLPELYFLIKYYEKKKNEQF